MNEDELLVRLESPLFSALPSEARGDADAAVDKTAAHPNDQDCSISESDNWKSAQQCFRFFLSSALSSEARGTASRNCGNVPTVFKLQALHLHLLFGDICPITNSFLRLSEYRLSFH